VGAVRDLAGLARVLARLDFGKDNFAADRAAGEEALEAFPGLISSVRANRAFLARTVRYLAGERGIRQFLDIGTGIPASSNTHEVAQSVAPETRVAYVDNDPMVLTHARALLGSRPRGATSYIDADLRDTGKILQGAAQTIDFSEPVAVMHHGTCDCWPRCPKAEARPGSAVPPPRRDPRSPLQ
jgi:hypothetical protein